jgi:hypothetical protein
LAAVGFYIELWHKIRLEGRVQRRELRPVERGEGEWAVGRNEGRVASLSGKRENVRPITSNELANRGDQLPVRTNREARSKSRSPRH